MELKSIFADEDAVSPVIGVILMVAITVILAAVIGAFVLGIGGNQEAAPQATLAFDYDTSATTWTLNHDGGQTVDGGQLSISASSSSLSGTCADPSDTQYSAGDTIASGCGYSSGETITVTWTASSGDSSQIIKESQAP